MITHDYDIIFVHIPKCAGRSIADIFNQRFDHFTARHYEREYREQWKTYFKFTIVRHPLARLVSIFTYISAHRRHRHEPIFGPNIGTVPDLIHYFKLWMKMNIVAYNADICRSGTLYPYSPEGLRGEDGALGSAFWFNSQVSRMITANGECDINFFKIEDGMERVEKYLAGIVGSAVSIPHSNKSSDEDWRTFYDKETLDLACNWQPIKEDMYRLRYHCPELQ